MSIAHSTSLAALADTGGPSAAWWAAVARALDSLDERLSEDAIADDGPAGSFAQAVWRAPVLANAVAKLRAERGRLADRVRGLRRTVATAAGDGDQVGAVSAEVGALAAAEDRYRRRSRELVWESFTRDIGGE